MAVHRATRTFGRVKLILLRRKLGIELDRLVATALQGSKYAPGTPALNRCVQQPHLLATLAGRLEELAELKAFFADSKFDLMLVRAPEAAVLLAASISRVHRCELGRQSDQITPSRRSQAA